MKHKQLMENVKDSEIDLGLALGISSNRDAGAGANANTNTRSRIDTNTTNTFLGPRPLTELVWSRQNGLTVKCAGCTTCFTDINPLILTDISQSQMSSQYTKDEKLVIGGHSVGPVATCHVGGSVLFNPGPLLGPSLCHTDENVGEVKCVHVIEMDKCNKGKEKECISSSNSIPADNVAGTSEGPKKRRTSDLLPLLTNEPENITDRLSLDIGLPLKMQEDGLFLEKVEETAENDVIIKDGVLKNVERDGKRGEEDSSTPDSMESCNSANKLLSKSNKRMRFEQQLIIGSKRIKKQSQEGPVVKQDSSFMNWISNMVKGGIKPYQKPVHLNNNDDDDDQKIVTKRLGFQNVFQSLYSQDPKRVQETKTQIESSKSKDIILFDKDRVPDDSLNQKAIGNLWITRLSPKTPSTLLNNNSDPKSFVEKDSSNDDASVVGLKPVAASKMSCFFCGKTGHESRDCLQINESRNYFFKNKVTYLNEIPNQIASTSDKKNKLLNEEKILRVPKQMFDTIRRLRLSRTDILKWMNSCLPIPNLDGYFLRLRLAKWEEGVGGAGYYVACITDEKPSRGSSNSKKAIRVNIGGVECLVESRYISNCDFLEEELIAWWRTTLTNGGGEMEEEELISKLEERKKLGF